MTFRITQYGVVNRVSSVLIIGGTCDGRDYNLVAKYKLDEWTQVGNLKTNRSRHRAIASGNRIFVVGGYGNQR